MGLDRWILLVFLAWTLAILHRQDGLTLEECAFLALVTVLPHVHLNRLLHLFSKNAESCTSTAIHSSMQGATPENHVPCLHRDVLLVLLTNGVRCLSAYPLHAGLRET